MSETAYRRVMGLALGALLGLSYGLVSQMLNCVMLPGLPLYQPPLGPIGNTLGCVLLGAILGFITAWPAGGVSGAFLGSALGAGLLVVVSLTGVQTTDRTRAGIITGVFFLLLPLVGMLAPLTGLFRRAVNGQVEGRRESAGLWARAWGPAALIIALGLAGALALYRPEARQALREMQALLHAGLSAPSAAALPAALQTEAVGGFLGQAREAYTLEWTQTNLNRFRIPRPLQNFDSHAVVVVRFANGWRLACLFIAPSETPTCQSD